MDKLKQGRLKLNHPVSRNFPRIRNLSVNGKFSLRFQNKKKTKKNTKNNNPIVNEKYITLNK